MIFFFAGMIRLIYATRNDISSSMLVSLDWNATVGAIYCICYGVLFFIDLGMFYTRNPKLFYYTLFTLGMSS